MRSTDRPGTADGNVAVAREPCGTQNFVSTAILPAGVSTWKVTVAHLYPNGHAICIGVTANASPKTYGFEDPAAFVWCSVKVPSEEVKSDAAVGGKRKSDMVGWGGWQAGDIAIMKLNRANGTFEMYHHRMKRQFVLSGLAGAADWRIYTNVHFPGERVEFSQP